MGKKFDGKSEKYPGVYWYNVPRPDGRRLERLYYIVYMKRGETRQHVEKLGRSGQFTERTASLIRAQKQEALQPTKKEKRQKEKEERLKGHEPLTFARLWELYQKANKHKPAIKGDTFRYNNHIAPYLAGKESEKITTGDIDGIRRKVEAKGLAPQTVKHVLGQIRLYAIWAIPRLASHAVSACLSYAESEQSEN